MIRDLGITIVVCSEISAKKSRRQVGVNQVISSRNLGGVMVRGMGLNLAPVVIFLNFITSSRLIVIRWILYNLDVVWLMNVSCTVKWRV